MKICDELCVLIVLVLKEALQRIYGTLIAGEKTGLSHQELQKATVMVVLIFCSYGVNPYKSVHVVSSVVPFKLPHTFEEICRWNFVGWYSARESI